MSKVLLHIDLNAFFATAERLRHPEWKDEPIIVGGETFRGVVSTCSYEARTFGVHSAMPIVEAKRLCPKGHFVPCDFPYYSMLSRSFFAYLRNISPLVEEASIDEGYVDITNAIRKEKEPLSFLKKIQDGLLSEIGLQSSLGVAPTKFLAKMASDMKKPMGITILRRKDLESLLYPLPISSFFGIGKKSAPTLEAHGIKTIGDLKKAFDREDPFLKTYFGKNYETLLLETNGYGNDVVDPSPWDPKSIGHSETFPFDTDDEKRIKEKIVELTHLTYLSLEREKKKTKTVQLTAKDSKFHSFTRSHSFEEGVSDEETLQKELLKLYEKNFLGKELRLVGVSFQNLLDPFKETVQMNFWNYPEYEKMDKTKLLVNELNRKLPKPLLRLASKEKEK